MDTRIVHCDPGYNLTGSDTMVCMGNGSWIAVGTGPVCVENGEYTTTDAWHGKVFKIVIFIMCIIGFYFNLHTKP